MYFLTEQAVAESVPDACRLAPDPPAFDARRKREVYPDDRHQKITQTYVDQQQIGGGAEPLEPAVEQNHRHVVAEPEHSDGSDGDRQKFVGSSREQVSVRASLGLVGRIHRGDANLVSSIVRRTRGKWQGALAEQPRARRSFKWTTSASALE